MRIGSLSLILLSCLGGCGPAPPATRPTDPAQWHPTPSTPLRFNPQTAVRVHGFVVWIGPCPKAPPIEGWLRVDSKEELRIFENPNQLRLHGDSGRVEGAVVILEDVDASEAGPWSHPPVRVLVSDAGIRVAQGPYHRQTRVGFVREGDLVDFVAEDHGSHVLSLRGSEFFGMPLPRVGVSRRHRFTERGVVEIFSAAYRPWHRAYLWVTPNPYGTTTNDRGEFTIELVPPGEYRIRVWHPNSEILSYERDPNTGRVTRLRFGSPFTASRHLLVRAGMDPVVLTLSK